MIRRKGRVRGQAKSKFLLFCLLVSNYRSSEEDYVANEEDGMNIDEERAPPKERRRVTRKKATKLVFW